MLTQGGQAQAQNPPLKFFNNYFLPGGDYAVDGVGLEGAGQGGLATGTITIAGVPVNQPDLRDDGHVVAAFLYAQVVSADGPDAGMAGATFRGFPLNSADGPLGQVLNPAGTAPCWSSGGGTGGGGVKRTYNYRFDILRTFDTVDGKPQVNGSHFVQLPDMGSWNSTPRALGASVVVVYSVPNQPLNAVVLYDGGYTMNNATDFMAQTLEGFYDPASGQGKMTHILGSAQANKSEILYFNGSPVSVDPSGANPFRSLQGPSWDNVTFDTDSTTLPQVTMRVDHAGFNSFDCLTWGAIIFRPGGVNDTDEDGIPDLLETTRGLVDPEGQPLPNLVAMGAAVPQRDLFVELGATRALLGTT